MSEATRARIALALVITSVVPIGLIARLHGGPAWLRNSSGAVLYEVAWIAAAQLVWVRARTRWLSIAVFLATCVIELLQRSDAPLLWAARSTTPGRLLLGGNGGFDLMDFPLYALGSLLGHALCRRLRVPG